jgi:hypothetical protein
MDSIISWDQDREDYYKYHKYEVTYDSLSLPDHYLEYGRNNYCGEWYGTGVGNYYSNPEGRIDSLYDMCVYPNMQYNYSYDSLDRIIVCFCMQWEDDVSDWKPYSTDSITYFDWGGVWFVDKYLWSQDDEWSIYYKMENYAYAPYRVTETYIKGIDQHGDFSLIQQYLRYFDDMGNDTMIFEWGRDYELNDFVYTRLFQRGFIDNLLINEHISHWNMDSMRFDMYSSRYLVYDIEDRIIEEEIELLDSLGGWQKHRKVDYSYFEDVEMESVYIPLNYSSDGSYSSMPDNIHAYKWNVFSQSYVDCSYINYYISSTGYTGVTASAPLYAKVYPNPAHNTLKLKLSAISSESIISIYNLSGQLQLNTTVNSDGSIDLSGLKPGMYVLRVDEGDEVFTEKIIVQ